MEKRKWLLMIMLFLIPIKVNALTGNISLDCSPINASSNANINCNIIASSDGEVSGISANISLSSNLEFVSFQPDSIWQGDATGNKIGLYTNENKIDTFNLGVLTVKVKDNVFDINETISLTNCLFSDKNFEKITINNASANIRIVSSNNKLSSLNISPGVIEFNSNTLDYSVETDSSTISINAVKEDSKATLSGNIGEFNLNYGINTFKIFVVSEGGEKRTYTLNVNRKDNRSTENRLSSLTINGVKFNFNENIYNYNISVPYETSSIKVNASLKDSKSSFVKGYDSGVKDLKEGLNQIYLKIQAENGTIKTYTLNITRGEDPENTSSDNYLENIEIENSNLNFAKEQYEYKMTVDYNTNNININAITSSSKSKVEISGNDNLQVGENIILIKVTSLDGEVREYKIIVTKKDKDQILSGNNYLKSLKIVNYDIDFNKEKNKYYIRINDEHELVITAIAEEDNANVVIEGNKNLKNKSIIKIEVTAEDGTTREYEINIVKNLEINYLLIVVIVETIIIIGVVIFFVIKNKRKKSYEES